MTQASPVLYHPRLLFGGIKGGAPIFVKGLPLQVLDVVVVVVLSRCHFRFRVSLLILNCDWTKPLRGMGGACGMASGRAMAATFLSR
jgi:hypothetical protein